MEIRQLTLSEWDSALPESGFEVFHTSDALRVLEAHSSGDLRLYAGYRGEQVVGLVPLFVRSGPANTRLITSPPPASGVLHLGPILMPSSPKQRKREKLNSEFVGGVLDAVAFDSRTLFYCKCSPSYGDPRPYEWRGMSVEPSFVYHVNVDRDADEILQSFSRSLRREIRRNDEGELAIERGDLEDARRIYEMTKRRWREQGETYVFEWEYVRDLLTALGERARTYVARDATGEFLGGIIVLYSNDAAYFWNGGTRASHENVSVNSLLHWEAIRDLDRDPPVDSVTTYDLMGGGMERLSKYKSKFNPELRPFYHVQSKGVKAARFGLQQARRLNGKIRRLASASS